VNFAAQTAAFSLPEDKWRQELSSVKQAPGAAQLAPYETRIYRQRD
jgi:hypothetical protein